MMLRIVAVLIVVLCSGQITAEGTTLPIDKSKWQLPHFSTTVTVVPEGTDGGPSLKIVTAGRDWSQQIRRLVFYPGDVARVVFTGRMKTDSVRGGTTPIEKARAQLVFLDPNGERVGNWPGTTDRDGTTPWADFRQEHNCPPGTRVVEVWLGMYLSTGTAWFSDLQLSAFDAGGKEIQPLPTPESEHTNTAGWIAFDPGVEQQDRPVVIDYGPFIPAPAGQFGFVKVKDGHLAFDDGHRVRFWGSGYVKNWNPPKEQVDAYAQALVRSGVNIVRLHGMDAMNPADTIFDASSPKTDRLDPAKLDRLDYLIAQLKSRGVYVDLNLLTKRRYLPGDGVPDAQRLPQGGKAAAMFDRRLIELQKDYARLLLTHVNPYTKLAYKDEPAIAVVEIINEASLNLLEYNGGLPESYEDQLDRLFTQWCAGSNVTRPEGHIRGLVKKRERVAERFVQSLSGKYFAEIAAYLKKDLGVRVPISGTQYTPTAGETRVQATLDLIDQHGYWDHPSGGWDPQAIFVNRPMVKIESKANIIEHLVGARVRGLPYMVSEWNFAWPNEYITEGPLLLSAYAGFNDWDAAMIFGTDGLKWSPAMTDTFAVENKPHVVAPLMASALAFYRGDVTPGPVLSVDIKSLPPETASDKIFSRDELLTRQCLISTTDTPPANRSQIANRDATQPAVYRSEDGQIAWSPSGLFTLDTVRTQAVLGFAGGTTVHTKDLTLTIKSPLAEVLVTSLTDDPIAKSPRLLITATARAENTGQAYRLFRHGLVDLGKPPILMEGVDGSIDLLHRSGPKPTVYAVDWYGRRTDQTIPVRSSGEGVWTIDLAQAVGWFEVTFGS